VAQYYNLIRLGKAGYQAIHQACQDVALYLAQEIKAIGPFELVSQGTDLPVFAWKLKHDAHWSLYDLADRLRDRGWQVPAYRMPANREDLVVQRAVIRNGFTCDLADLLVRDIRRHLDWFASQPGLRPKLDGAAFHH
jgi:glutamate decarboxylase